MRSRHSLFVHSPELLVFFCSWKMGDVWDAAALGGVCALDVPKKRAFVPPDWTVRNRIVVVVCVSAAERTGNRIDFFLRNPVKPSSGNACSNDEQPDHLQDTRQKCISNENRCKDENRSKNPHDNFPELLLGIHSLRWRNRLHGLCL